MRTCFFSSNWNWCLFPSSRRLSKLMMFIFCLSCSFLSLILIFAVSRWWWSDPTSTLYTYISCGWYMWPICDLLIVYCSIWCRPCTFMNPPMFEEAASIFNRCPLQMLNSLSPLLDLTSSAISPTTSSSQPVLSDPICTLKSSKSILSWDHSLHLLVELQVAFVIPNGVHN